MNSLSLRTPWLCALFAAAAAWSPAIAAAQDCTDDADCGDGYRCQTDSYESCGGSIMCTPDGECGEAPGDCETVTYSWCTNAICNADADCPSSMACQAQTTWQCDGGGAGSGGAAAGAGGAAGTPAPMEPPTTCPPGEKCPTEESTCYEVPADSICIPRYQLPCTVASDCGGGFECLQSSYWECSGGGSADRDAGMASGGSSSPRPLPAAGAGGADTEIDADGGVAPDYECHEVPSTDHYCQLQDLPCSADAECPDGLKCLDQYIWTCTGSGSAGAGSAGASSAGAGGATAPGEMAMDADAGVSDGSECSTQTQQRCMPPDYAGSPGGDGSGSGGMTGGGYADGGVAPPTEPGSGNSGPGSAGAGGAAGGTSSDEGDSDDDSDDHHHHGHGHLFGWLALGCSAGGPIGGDPVGWLALGMVTLVLRRRARRG